MPVYAEGRVEHQKRTQTATTLWPFGFVFGVQLGSLEKRKRGVLGTCRAGSFSIRNVERLRWNSSRLKSHFSLKFERGTPVSIFWVI